MKHLVAAIILATTAGTALAQTAAQPANPKPDTPAVTTPSTPSQAQPAKGANSFTETQAKTRLEEAGFTSVTGLKKDDNGVWRGKGMKAGASHDVALDYQGNIFPK